MSLPLEVIVPTNFALVLKTEVDELKVVVGELNVVVAVSNTMSSVLEASDGVFILSPLDASMVVVGDVIVVVEPDSTEVEVPAFMVVVVPDVIAVVVPASNEVVALDFTSRSVHVIVIFSGALISMFLSFKMTYELEVFFIVIFLAGVSISK